MKVNEKKLQEMVQEAISSYLDEMDYRQRIAAAAKGGAGGDKVSIDKLISILDGMEKSGKAAVSPAEIQAAMKQAIQVSAPLGKGSPQALAQKAASPTGGAPVMAPPSSVGPREGKTVSITKGQLQEMVNRIIEARLLEFSTSNNPIMAKREIIALMDSTSRNFENEIIKTFKLQNPDMLSPELQRKYLEVVEGMKAELVAAAMKAVQELIHFPKQDEGNGALKGK